jgi:Ca2+-binding RTX toxin-like protein
MRANTKKKHEMGKRFAILIGVAAAGVMALGAQTGAQTPAPTPPGQAPPTCNGLAATIVGTEGSDNPLDGTPGRDVIVGLGESDGISGGRGNDVIFGGAGDDFLVGGKGKDTLLGQAGGDVFFGKAGKDRCEGGKGKDGALASDCEVEKSIEEVRP